MYIEFSGPIRNRVVDGFAGQYSALIRIDEIHEYTFEIQEACK